MKKSLSLILIIMAPMVYCVKTFAAAAYNKWKGEMPTSGTGTHLIGSAAGVEVGFTESAKTVSLTFSEPADEYHIYIMRGNEVVADDTDVAVNGSSVNYTITDNIAGTYTVYVETTDGVQIIGTFEI